MKAIIFIQSGFEVNGSVKKIRETIKVLKKDKHVLTCDYIEAVA